MKPEIRQFKLNVPASLFAALKEIAVRESRSVSAQVNLMLREKIEADQISQK